MSRTRHGRRDQGGIGRRQSEQDGACPPPRLTSSDSLLLFAFLCSGASALGLELIWLRLLGLAFGSETFGTLAVLAGLFAGLALGAAILHRVALRSRRPVLIYMAAEMAVAVYAFFGPVFLFRLADTLPRLLGPVVGDNRSLGALSINLSIGAVALLPATFAMGITVAALVEAWQRRRTPMENLNTVAWLYAANTVGATIGICLAIYGLLPKLGLTVASDIFGAISLVAVWLAWRWERSGVHSASEHENECSVAIEGRRRLFLYGLLFATGLAGIGLEIAGTQALAQIFLNTIHTFANIVVVYLFGTAAGAYLYATRLAHRFRADRDQGTAILLMALSLSTIVSAAALSCTTEWMDSVAPLGSPYAQTVLSEALISALVYLLPTMAMGATFSHLLGYFTLHGVGYATAVNTTGASLAPLVFGLVLIPMAGYGAAWYAALAIYLILFATVALRRQRRARWAAPAFLGLALLAWWAYSPLMLVRFAPNVKLLAQEIGFHGIVSVTQDGPSRILQVGQSTLMGGSPGWVTRRMGQLPMLLAFSPREVLYLGVGTGLTAGGALDFPVERVTGVELIPEVLQMLPWFSEYNHGLQNDGRASLHVSDARRFVRASAAQFDVIVADLYHPSHDGIGSLYTLEHFTAIRAHLRDAGLFVQWLPLYQLPPTELKTIVATFLQVFPDAGSAIANYSGNARLGLLGWTAPIPIDIQTIESRLSQQKDRTFEGVPDVLSSYMLDAAALRAYSADAIINTDANQRILFDAAPAANITFSIEGRSSLASLLPYRRPFPDELVRASSPEDRASLRRNVEPYAEAVSRYLNAEVIRLNDPSGGSFNTAIEEYLRAYQLDARFTLAAGKILEMSLQRPAFARDMVDRIWRVHPEQADFTRLRERVAGVTTPREVAVIIGQFIQSGGE